MRRAQQDYEDKAMSSRREKPDPEPSGPAPAGGSAPAPAGPPADLGRPSEREAVGQAEEGGARPSERELAEEAAEQAEAQREAAPKP
jgi:hypothetical protein